MRNVNGLFFPDDDREFTDLINAEPGKAQYQTEALRLALKATKKRYTAIDVGAHVGLITRKMAKHFKHVVAIEPNPENYECLIANTRHLDNVICVKMAMGADTHMCKMSYKNGRSGQGHVSFDQLEGDDAPMSTLDSVSQKLDLKKISLLKIDTQGYEYQVLRGAEITLEFFKPIVIVEEHPNQCYEDRPFRATASLAYDYGAEFVARHKRNFIMRLRHGEFK